jgi:hypothetical protein
VRAHHDSKIAGHLGTLGTLELVSRKYWWKEITMFVKRYVQGCYSCACNKVRNQRPARLLQPLPNPEGPWLWTQSDFVTQLPPSWGFDAIYVIVDRLMKMAHFILCKTTCTAEQLAECYIMVFAIQLYKAYYLVGSLYYNYYFSYLPISCL